MPKRKSGAPEVCEDTSSDEDMSGEPWSFKRLRTKALQRPDLPRRPNCFFKDLPLDVRNIIYSYLSLPPLDNSHRKNVNFLALTCRQARDEAAEEGLRRFWIFLQKTSQKTTKKTGRKLLLPTELNSKDALAGLQDLTVIIKGQIDFKLLPKKFFRFAQLRLRSVTVHCSDIVHDKHGIGLVYHALGGLIKRASRLDERKARLVRCAISWDCCTSKTTTILDGFRFTVSKEFQYNCLGPFPDEEVLSWPRGTSVASGNNDVGLISVDLGSKGSRHGQCWTVSSTICDPTERMECGLQ